MPRVYFYTSCTLTKSRVAPVQLALSSFRHRSLAERAVAWKSRLESWKGERIPAQDLYDGGAWALVKSLIRSKSEIHFRIISAGYGLVAPETLLSPYAATFASRHGDSVARGIGRATTQENRFWWGTLSRWPYRQCAHPRSITETIRTDKNAVHLFALSPNYLDAISEDLAAALREVGVRERVIIVSQGKKRHGSLNENIVHAPADLQTLLGGSLVSLNVNVVASALNSIDSRYFTVSGVRDYVQTLHAEASPRNYPVRQVSSDSAVLRFIASELKTGRSASYTGLLRQFRRSGKACEMKRFKRLFQQIAVPNEKEKNR